MALDVDSMTEQDFRNLQIQSFNALVKRADEERAALPIHNYETAMLESLDGDASLIPLISIRFRNFFLGLDPDPLTENETLWIAVVVSRFGRDEVAQAISGKSGPGAPKNGLKAMKIAIDVLEEVRRNGATSMQGAWEAVADKAHLDVETVRQYWSRWKGPLTPHGGDQAVRAMVRDNKLASSVGGKK